MDFLIDYKKLPFMETSKTGSHWNRLNWRCEILLTRNKESVKGKRILDLASHDGRFSYACLKLGAKHVAGVEGREHLVKYAKENISKLGYSSQSYDFIQEDLFSYLSKIKKGQFDTILCFGFFYHTIRQIELLQEVARIKPDCFILDSSLAGIIFPADGFKFNILDNFILKYKHLEEKITKIQTIPAFVYDLEDCQLESSTIHSSGFVARPTEAFLKLFFKNYNWQFHKLEWSKKEIKDWTWIQDYKAGKRVSYFCKIPNI